MVPQKGKGSLSCPLSWCAGSLVSEAHHRQDTVKTKVHEGNFSNPVFTRHFQNSKHLENVSNLELRLLTDVDSCHFPLAQHSFTNIQTLQQRHTVPLRLPYTQYTHHNDLARPKPHGLEHIMYLLQSNLPFGF